MNSHPNELTDKIVPDSVEKINENRLKQLQQIAKDSIFEPFEGKKSLETIQKTRSGLEKGMGHLKTATSKSKHFSITATNWLKGTKAFQSSKNKVKQMVSSDENSNKDGVLSQFSAKLSKRVVELKSAFDLIDKATEGFQESTKKTYKDLELKTREMSIDYTQKGLELLIVEDTEKWIVPKAAEILQRDDIKSFKEIRDLTNSERNELIEQLYPYNSPLFQKYLKAFDVTFNISLGAIVASNIPGTGLLVSFINIGKTLIKLGNRLNIISAIHGYRIESPQALFKTCSKIIQSLEDWEKNHDHRPLSPDSISELFDPPADKEDFFQDLMASVIKKEAYIAIPGVGMISLGKINMDDLKMDLVVQHLISNYFTQKEISSVCNEVEMTQVLDDFKVIYSELKSYDILKSFIQRVKDEAAPQKGNIITSRLKKMAGSELAVEKASYEFDMLAKAIYIKIQNLPSQEKPQRIKEEIEKVAVKQLMAR